MQVLCGFTDGWDYQVEQTLRGVPVLCPGKHTGHREVRACLQQSAAGICQHLTARQWHVSRKISGESWVLSWSQALHKHVALNSMFAFLKSFEYILGSPEISEACFVLFFSECLETIWPVFWPWPVACGILVPQPGIRLVPTALEAQRLSHWTTRGVGKSTKALLN